MADYWGFASAAAYLIGSIPFGLLAAKLFGCLDPRIAGSGNIGFTNVLRVCGRKAGLFTLAGDFGKGLLIGWLVFKIGMTEPQALLVLLSVVLGHIFSIFLMFRGGKGVATALGAMLGYDASIGFLLLCIWGLAVLMWRYSSGGAISAFIALPILASVLGRSSEFIIFCALLSAIILWKHKGNIQRLLLGGESKIGAGKVSS